MNFPNLPDSIFKLLVYLGIGLMVYSFLNYKNSDTSYSKLIIEFNSQVKKLESQSKELDTELKEISEEADSYSKKYNISNPLIVTDSNYKFVRTISGPHKIVMVSDTIGRLLKTHDYKLKELRQKNSELSIEKFKIDEYEKAYTSSLAFSAGSFVFGLLCFLTGFAGWLKKEQSSDHLILRQNLDKPTFSKICQSCGRVFNSLTLYGKEKNGEKNFHFCSICYVDGIFSEPELSLTALQARVNEELKNKGFSKRKIKQIIKDLNNCDRWNFPKYNSA